MRALVSSQELSDAMDGPFMVFEKCDCPSCMLKTSRYIMNCRAELVEIICPVCGFEKAYDEESNIVH